MADQQRSSLRRHWFQRRKGISWGGGFASHTTMGPFSASVRPTREVVNQTPFVGGNAPVGLVEVTAEIMVALHPRDPSRRNDKEARSFRPESLELSNCSSALDIRGMDVVTPRSLWEVPRSTATHREEKASLSPADDEDGRILRHGLYGQP